MNIRNMFLTAAAFAAVMAGQDVVGQDAAPRGAPLKLVPSEPLTEPHFARQAEAPKKPGTSESGVRPAILQLQPPGDPIYLVEEPAGVTDLDKWRTHQRPKVDRFSRDGAGAALQGYDVISYLERHAEKGNKEFSVEYGEVRWQFASAEHRDQFRRDPEHFVPEYGGFCAYSVGRGYPATADPRVYTVVDGKLYVFFDKAVQMVWEQDRRRLLLSAERYWPQLQRPLIQK
jgi:YHS domain-containing protein